MCAVPTSPSLVSAAVFSAPRSLLRCSRPDPPAALARPVARYATQWPQVCRVLRCIRPYCRIWRRSGTWSVNLEKSSKGVFPAGTTKTCQEMYETPQEDCRFACGGWKRRGSVQGYWGGGHWCRRICHQNCTWPTVVGVSARGVRSWAVVRLLQGPIAHGSTWDEEGGKISSPLGDRSGVFQCPGWGGRGPCNAVGGAAVVRVANCWMQLPTQWMGHAIYLGVCGRVRGDAEVEDCSEMEKPGFDDALWVQDWGGEVGMCRELPS